MTTTNNYEAELRSAQRRFAERTKGLSPRVLRLQLLADVNKATGFNRGEIDPIERAWAAQALATLTAQDEIARLEKAHADLTATRDPRQSQADRLLALQKLEQKRDIEKIKLIAAVQQDHGLAAREAREAYARRDADMAQTAAIRSAAKERAATTIADNHPAVAGLAAVIVERSTAI